MDYDQPPGRGSRHSVTAFFDDRAHADKARADLLAAGFRDEDIALKAVEQAAADTVSGSHREGILRSLVDIFVFMPPPDQLTYAEALQRGGVALAVRTSPEGYERAIDILDRDGAANLDEREATWMSEGAMPSPAVPREGGPGSPEQATFEADNRHDPLVNPTANRDVRERIGTGTANMAAATDPAPESAAATAPPAPPRPSTAVRDTTHGRERVRSYIDSTDAMPPGPDPQI
ncbi:MAG TPA: hypothetical protein VH414_12055 [Lichenihabitans sp.]|jgi:hypothetical protein|nr:hypothetical protein [Lichenihabitans sp.]